MSRRDDESRETAARRLEDGVIRLHQQAAAAAAAAAPVPTCQPSSHTDEDADSNLQK